MFSSTVRPNGEPGLFHPDRLTFGEPIRLSRLYAAAQGVSGVRYVEITSLKRQGTAGGGNALDAGGLEFGAYEVPVLANDPNFPDRGFVSFTMTGGR